MLVKPSDIRLIIMTVQRSPEYVHKTLASLMLSDPLAHQLKGVHLVVGGPNVEYLSPYKHHDRLTIHPMTLDESEQIRDWILRRKFCYNYHRCLTLPEPDYHGLCICEDDVIFQDRFIEKMLAAINEMENKHKIVDYLLDFYLPYGFSPDPSFSSGILCTKYYPQTFYGTQCMYYPCNMVPLIAQLIYELGVVDYQSPGDMLIGQYATDNNLLYGTKYSLVQHIGFQSTGLAGIFHRSPYFDKFEPSLELVSNCTGVAVEKLRFNFRESVGGTIKTLGFMAQRKGLELIFDVTAEAPEIIVGYPFLLCQVLYILVKNAIKFTEKGEIIIHAEVKFKDENSLLLEWIVSDTGTGAQRMICETLLNDDSNIISANDTTKQDITICATIVDMMGGELWVNDKNEVVSNPEGSVFQFTVPFNLDKKYIEQSVHKPIEELRNLSVLIVDNNSASRKMLTDVLVSWGMKPTAVDSGKVALQLLNEIKLTDEATWIVLLDAVMPEMNGFEVARQINKMPNFNPLVLMMLSYEVVGAMTDLCREVGVRSYINKPILHSELLEAFLYFVSLH